MDRLYEKGFFDGIDFALNTINTIEEQGKEFRKILYQKLMDARPNGPLVKRDNN